MCKTILVVRDIRKKTSEIGAPSQVQLHSQEILCRPKRQQSLTTANQRPNIVYDLTANTINTEWTNKWQQLVLPMCSLVFIVCIYLKTKILRGGMTSLERAFTLHTLLFLGLTSCCVPSILGHQKWLTSLVGGNSMA